MMERISAPNNLPEARFLDRMPALRADEPSTRSATGFLGVVPRSEIMPICIKTSPSMARSRRCSQNTRCCSARRLYVDRIWRNFGPMRRLVKAWQRTELMGVTAKVVIYEAFIEGRLEAPEHLTHSVHDLYFEPKYEEFRLMIRTQHTKPFDENAVTSTVTPYAIHWEPQHSHGGPRSSPTCRRRRRAWKIVINAEKLRGTQGKSRWVILGFRQQRKFPAAMIVTRDPAAKPIDKVSLQDSKV